MRSHGHWKPGKWMDPAMATGGRIWTQRQMVQVNQWTSRMDSWRIMDLLRQIEDKKTEEFQATFAQCMYGKQSSTLHMVSAVCAADRVTGNALSSMLAKDTKMAEVSAFPTVAEDVGSRAQSYVGIKSTSFTAESKVTLYTSTETRTGTQKTTNSAGRFAPRSTAVQQHKSSTEGFSTRSQASLDDAACWSKVKNTNGHLVGQIMGNCLKMTSTASIASPISVCLQIKSSIKTYSEYTVNSFVKRTGSVGSYSYTPTTISVTNSGVQMCGDVTESNVYYCPALVVSGWSSKTSDIGSDICEAMLKLTGQTVPGKNNDAGSASDASDNKKNMMPLILASSAGGAVLASVVLVFVVKRMRKPSKKVSGSAATGEESSNQTSQPIQECADGMSISRTDLEQGAALPKAITESTTPALRLQLAPIGGTALT